MTSLAKLYEDRLFLVIQALIDHSNDEEFKKKLEDIANPTIRPRVKDLCKHILKHAEKFPDSGLEHGNYSIDAPPFIIDQKDEGVSIVFRLKRLHFNSAEWMEISEAIATAIKDDTDKWLEEAFKEIENGRASTDS